MKGLAYRLVLVGGLSLGFASIADQVYAAGVTVEAATAAQKKEAQGKFLKAMTEYEAKKLDKALAGFKASYDIVASPNSHYMIARTLRDLGKLNEAAAEYQGVIDEASKDTRYGDTLSSAKSEFDELKTRLAFVTVELKGAGPDAKVEIAGKPLDAAKVGTPVIVEAGAVTVIVRTAKGEEKKTVTAAVGKTEAVTFDFAAAAVAPTPTGPTQDQPGGVKVDTKKFGMKQWAYVAGGVGAAGLLTFGIFGLMNNAKYNDLNDACAGGHCPPDKSGDIDTGKKYQTIANVGLVVGIVGIGTGTVLYVLGSKKKPAEQPPASARMMPQVAVGPGSVLVTGQF
ncbi:MAG: hypothetical protein HY898_19655 [Deltaproteobacteria bacterium]|nr:hypothetical protein [Deltaproteobacteria bacterium]